MRMAHRTPVTGDDAPLAAPSAGRASLGAHDAILLAGVDQELRAAFDALAELERGVSVFGSARTAPGDPDYELARSIAARLGREGFTIITGGGMGIMEAANRGAREARSPSIGLTIELPAGERVNSYLDVQLRFRHFFTRKAMFVRYAQAFVVFPGGFGTLGELFELAALIQTRKLSAPSVVLVRRSYWEPLLDWLRDSALGAGNISSPDLALLELADDEQEACARVSAAAKRI